MSDFGSVHPMDSLVQKSQLCNGPELRRPTCDPELVPLSEVQCHARPVAARVGSLLSDRSERTRRRRALAVRHAAQSGGFVIAATGDRTSRAIAADPMVCLRRLHWFAGPR